MIAIDIVLALLLITDIILRIREFKKEKND